MGFVDRENEVLRIMDVLSKSGIDLIVVGGYAVSSLTRHRSSVDCDLVVRSRDLKRIDEILASEGFSKEEEQAGFDKEYGGKFIRYVKKIADLPVSVDLLVDSLVCRETDASWSYDYILSNSRAANVPGIQLSVTCRIAATEILIAFKLHSARKPDVRDVVMLGQEADWSKVTKQIRKGDLEKLCASIKQVMKDLDDKRLVNSLKGVFSLKEDVGPNISKVKEEVRKILSSLESAHRKA